MNQRIQLPSGPTEWVSPVVVVPKPDGDICIFVDIRKARKAIERERHPIPTIEDIMHDLNKFMVFSKLQYSPKMMHAQELPFASAKRKLLAAICGTLSPGSYKPQELLCA